MTVEAYLCWGTVGELDVAQIPLGSLETRRRLVQLVVNYSIVTCMFCDAATRLFLAMLATLYLSSSWLSGIPGRDCHLQHQLVVTMTLTLVITLLVVKLVVTLTVTLVVTLLVTLVVTLTLTLVVTLLFVTLVV